MYISYMQLGNIQTIGYFLHQNCHGLSLYFYDGNNNNTFNDDGSSQLSQDPMCLVAKINMFYCRVSCIE